MSITITDVLKHVEYVIWSRKAVKLANIGWRAKRPYRGEELMTKEGFDHWLYHWAIDTGRLGDPGPVPPQGMSAYVAVVFDREREAVMEEARNYWRAKVEEQA